MRYSIMIKDTKDSSIYRLLKIKKEVTETITEEVTDETTGVITTTNKEVGTGEYVTATYETTDKDEFEKKIVEMLNTYNRNQILPIGLEDYNMDLIFVSDSDNA